MFTTLIVGSLTGETKDNHSTGWLRETTSGYQPPVLVSDNINYLARHNPSFSGSCRSLLKRPPIALISSLTSFAERTGHQFNC